LRSQIFDLFATKVSRSIRWIEAIEEVDGETGNAPAYYMINCGHPTHFDGTLAGKAQWINRIRGIRANASRRSHAELNEAPISTPVILPNWEASTLTYGGATLASMCWAAAAVRIIATSSRSPAPARHDV
jgi:hypothetical protein